MKYCEVVDGIVTNTALVDADSAADWLAAQPGQWVEDVAGSAGKGWSYDGAIFSPPAPQAAAPEPGPAIISVRNLTEIIGTNAMQAIRQAAKTDENYALLWDLGQMTGDADRSAAAFGVVMDDLLAGNHITQEQYDKAWPPQFRP